MYELIDTCIATCDPRVSVRSYHGAQFLRALSKFWNPVAYFVGVAIRLAGGNNVQRGTCTMYGTPGSVSFYLDVINRRFK